MSRPSPARSLSTASYEPIPGERKPLPKRAHTVDSEGGSTPKSNKPDSASPRPELYPEVFAEIETQIQSLLGRIESRFKRVIIRGEGFLDLVAAYKSVVEDILGSYHRLSMMSEWPMTLAESASFCSSSTRNYAYERMCSLRRRCEITLAMTDAANPGTDFGDQTTVPSNEGEPEKRWILPVIDSAVPVAHVAVFSEQGHPHMWYHFRDQYSLKPSPPPGNDYLIMVPTAPTSSQNKPEVLYRSDRTKISHRDAWPYTMEYDLRGFAYLRCLPVENRYPLRMAPWFWPGLSPLYTMTPADLHYSTLLRQPQEDTSAANEGKPKPTEHISLAEYAGLQCDIPPQAQYPYMDPPFGLLRRGTSSKVWLWPRHNDHTPTPRPEAMAAPPHSSHHSAPPSVSSPMVRADGDRSPQDLRSPRQLSYDTTQQLVRPSPVHSLPRHADSWQGSPRHAVQTMSVFPRSSHHGAPPVASSPLAGRADAHRSPQSVRSPSFNAMQLVGPSSPFVHSNRGQQSPQFPASHESPGIARQHTQATLVEPLWPSPSQETLVELPRP